MPSAPPATNSPGAKAPETNDPSANTGRKSLLPRIGSPTYHLMLATVAIFILGPLGGISIAFMSFSIGFFVSGQVLAGILGRLGTFPYGPGGKPRAHSFPSPAAGAARKGRPE